MSEDLLADGGQTQLSMNQSQFAQLMTTVAAALRQPAAAPDRERLAVALQYRLLRNGLGRFQSASEAFDQALIRIDQIQHQDWIELVFRDPIPADARSMVLIIDSQRFPQSLPDYAHDGRRTHRISGEAVSRIVELVEFLDEFDVPIAAGVPVQLPGYSEDLRNSNQGS